VEGVVFEANLLASSGAHILSSRADSELWFGSTFARELAS
jgi:hypothetical protein